MQNQIRNILISQASKDKVHTSSGKRDVNVGAFNNSVLTCVVISGPSCI